MEVWQLLYAYIPPSNGSLFPLVPYTCPAPGKLSSCYTQALFLFMVEGHDPSPCNYFWMFLNTCVL